MDAVKKREEINKEAIELKIRVDRLRKGAEKKEPSAWVQQIWEEQNAKFAEYAEENVDEQDHWKFYRSKHLNDKYFKLEHIEDIGLPFEVAMVLTKRGTGKTVAYMNLIKKLYYEGKQFVIVRNTQQEIKGGVIEQFASPDCIFTTVRDKYVVLRENKDIVVGYLAYLSGAAQQWQGAGYEKVHTIIWDEATNAGLTTTKTRTWIWNFWQLTSTFFRNKLEWRVWIFGNLMKVNQGEISDTLHRNLGIDTDVNFKYITNSSQHGLLFRLLYINTSDLYSGSDDQLMANIQVDQQVKADLLSNKPFKVADCIIGDYFFVKAQRKEWGIFTTFDKQDWMILIASEPNINYDKPEELDGIDLGSISDRFFIVKCEELKPHFIGSKDFKIFTDDAVLATAFKNYCYYKLELKKHWYKLWKLLKSGRTLFVGDNSYKNLLRIMSGRKDIIKSYREELFPKKKAKKKSSNNKK